MLFPAPLSDGVSMVLSIWVSCLQVQPCSDTNSIYLTYEIVVESLSYLPNSSS